jgi:pSer/pThr/pTyr-binding forkhead associated (FHA) protein
MSVRANGELVPVGGGDNIPLIRESLTLGRRDSCDVRLPFPNVSGLHAQLTFKNGYWYVRDMNSTNGIKVNGVRVQEKLLHPKDKLTIGKRDYVIRYDLPADAIGKLEEVQEDDVMAQSLMEKAGLEKPREQRKKGGFDPARFLLDDE